MRLTGAATLLALAPLALAQIQSDCDPRRRDGCAPNPALGSLAQFNWTNTQADSDVWNTIVGPVNYASDGAEFKISRKGQSPTLESKFYIMWGRVSVVMKAAPGDGIVSSVVMWSDDMDEIDWEWIGGKTNIVQTNFFGKGDNTTYDRAAWHTVDNILNEHNYTVVWTKEQMEFLIDGKSVRVTKYDDPMAMSKGNGTHVPGDRFPQTPLKVRLGIWAGGDPDLNAPGVVQWAFNNTNGGSVDYSKAPFVQTISSVQVHDFSTGKEYTYGDRSGSWQSIKATTGKSSITEAIESPRGIVNKFNALSPAAKIGIGIGAASVAGILLILLAFCCIKNRRAGKKERAIADAEWESNLQELQRYKRAMVAEEEIHPRAGYI